MPPLVSILMTTYNSAAALEACLESVAAVAYAPLEVIIVDNHSTDRTPEILRRYEGRFRITYNAENLGFTGGQNAAIAQSRGEWLLSLNPDVRLAANFISELVSAGEQDESAGSLCGKLMRWPAGEEAGEEPVIDSTGIYFTRNLRHFDRGAEEVDCGLYERPEYVFGATGAAAMYRRRMVEDVSVDGEFYDDDFFAYREDADLSWRAQILGWKCRYVPTAVAWHVRRVTPERFHRLPLLINWHSVKNRFLMRAKNISPWLYWRLLLPTTWRDLLIVGYCVLKDRRLLSALQFVWQRREVLRTKRRQIQARRRVSDRDLARWFQNEPASFPG
jgi:GT2 family glycosyltransferase